MFFLYINKWMQVHLFSVFFFSSLFINLLGLWLILLCAVFAGMCLYSIYKSCDPWTSGLLSALDQV